jgi:SPP1 family predicted phage head-tail adaptor
VVILNKQAAAEFGATTSYEPAATVWADVTWQKGMKRLAEASLDAMDTVMIRMRYNTIVNERSRIIYDGKTYQIIGETFHADRQENTIQFHAQQIINDK